MQDNTQKTKALQCDIKKKQKQKTTTKKPKQDNQQKGGAKWCFERISMCPAMATPHNGSELNMVSVGVSVLSIRREIYSLRYLVAMTTIQLL